MLDQRNNRNAKWNDCLAVWHSVDPEQNRYRFYVLSIEKDLWGNSCLIQRWGRIGKKAREKVTVAADENELKKFAFNIFQQRMWHGYELVYHAAFLHDTLSTPA
ncbi:WGR domain-containing protein [Candidatus Acetothermia bacterium]|nr:WGR domain-containing protein [Candidatus Acetothermia bacterium]